MYRNKLHESIMIGIKRALFENADNIVPTESLMEQWFDEFNKKFFNNELPYIKLEIGNCGNVTLGYFKYQRLYNSNTRRWNEPFNPDKCSIRLTNVYAASEYNLKNVMLHEMVHYWIYYHYNFKPAHMHGNIFMLEADKINKISEWNITPISDDLNNVITDEGLKRYKSRIADEYIICIFEYYDRYGMYHVIRTDDKYMNQVYKTLLRGKTNNLVWYKLKTDNLKFGVTEPICKGGRTLSYMYSGYSIDELFKKIEKQYGKCEYEKFEPYFNNDKLPLYLCILNRRNVYMACKLENTKFFDKLREKLEALQYAVSFYRIEKYNNNFDLSYSSKSNFTALCTGYSYDDFVQKLKNKFDIDINEIEKI